MAPGALAGLLARLRHRWVRIDLPRHTHRGIVVRVRRDFVTLVEPGPHRVHVVLRHVLAIEPWRADPPRAECAAVAPARPGPRPEPGRTLWLRLRAWFGRAT